MGGVEQPGRGWCPSILVVEAVQKTLDELVCGTLT